MKKIVGILLLMAGGICFASNVDFFIVQKPEVSFEARFSYPFVKSEEFSSPGFSIKEGFSMPCVDAEVGLKRTSDIVNVLCKTSYAPLFFDMYNIGLEARYHYYEFEEMFTEHDFLTGIFIANKTNDFFTFRVGIDFFYKRALINSLPPEFQTFENFSYAIDSFFQWKINDYVQPYFSISSYEAFYYPLFATPIIKIGMESQLLEKFKAGCDCTFVMTDGFTTRTHLSRFDVSLFIKVKTL